MNLVYVDEIDPSTYSFTNALKGESTDHNVFINILVYVCVIIDLFLKTYSIATEISKHLGVHVTGGWIRVEFQVERSGKVHMQPALG